MRSSWLRNAAKLKPMAQTVNAEIVEDLRMHQKLGFLMNNILLKVQNI